MATLLREFARDQRGEVAIEYVLIASFVGIAIITAATAIGSNLKAILKDVVDNL